MDFISTFRELQYDDETGELVVREGKDCRCIGLTTTVEAPELFHIVKLPRPVDIMITQVYEYSYGPDNKPKLIIPEKIHYTGNSVEITFGEKISSVVRFNVMFVCGYEYDSLGILPSVTPTNTPTVTVTPTQTVTPTPSSPCMCLDPTDLLAALNDYPAIPTLPTYTTPFIFTIDALDSVEVVLPLSDYMGGAYDARIPHYDFVVDWGDGNSDTITSFDQTEKSHLYATSGIKTISITGLFEALCFGESGAATASKVLEIQQWGVTGLRSIRQAFDGCNQMTITAADEPDLSLVTGQWACGSAFRDCTFTSGLEGWDTSAIRCMESMFENSACSSDLSGWDVSNVREMLAMFQSSTFNNDSLANWDVSQVEDMTAMFSNSSFAGDVSGWRTPRCVFMDSMFYRCYTFDSDMSLWDVSSVQTMSGMLRETAVSGDFSLWNPRDCYSFSTMFYGCTSFNSDISGWDVSNGESFSSMFNGATIFNQDLSGWNIRLGKFMSSMFTGCALDTTNYDLILNAWSQIYPKENVTLTTDAQYTIATSQAARDILTSEPWTWTINDGGGI